MKNKISVPVSLLLGATLMSKGFTILDAQASTTAVDIQTHDFADSEAMEINPEVAISEVVSHPLDDLFGKFSGDVWDEVFDDLQNGEYMGDTIASQS